MFRKSLGDLRGYKSPEELAKEKTEREQREKEAQEKEDELRTELDDQISNLDSTDEMKFALEHIKEPDKITKHINSNSSTYFETYIKLSTLRQGLEIRAKFVDLKARLDGEISDSNSRLVRLLQSPDLPQVSPLTPHSKEGDELRELARLLNKQADFYFNNRKELGDDDPNATPLTLFTVRRLVNFFAAITR